MAEDRSDKNVARRIKLLTDGDYSDFELRCGGTVFKIHKAIIAGKSPFLDALIGKPFKECNQVFAELPKEDPLAVMLVLWYLYTEQYSPATTYSGWSDSEKAAIARITPEAHRFVALKFSSHVKVAQLADQWLLPELVDLASRALYRSLECLFISSLVSDDDFDLAVKTIFDGTDILLETAQGLVWRILYNLAYEMNSFDLEQLRPLAQSLPKFSWYLFSELLRKLEIDQVECTNCGTFENKNDLYFVVLSDSEGVSDKTAAWMSCKCSYRGFCDRGARNHSCRLLHGDAEDILVLCHQCRYSKAKVKCNVVSTALGIRVVDTVCKVSVCYFQDDEADAVDIIRIL